VWAPSTILPRRGKFFFTVGSLNFDIRLWPTLRLLVIAMKRKPEPKIPKTSGGTISRAEMQPQSLEPAPYGAAGTEARGSF